MGASNTRFTMNLPMLRWHHASTLIPTGNFRRFLCDRKLRILAVPVRSGVAVLHHENKQQETDQRNQREQEPPAAAIRVVKTPDRYRDTRNEDCQTVDRPEWTKSNARDLADDAVDHRQRDSGHDVEQEKIPIFAAARAAGRTACTS